MLSCIDLDSLQVEKRWCVCNGAKQKHYALVFRLPNNAKETILPIPKIESDGDTLNTLYLALDKLRSTHQ